MTFPERLKEARIRSGLKQQELAHRLGVKTNSISNYENGKSEPSYKALEVIVKNLDVDVDWLLFGSEKDSGIKKHTIEDSRKGIPLIPLDAMAGFGNGDLQVLEHECDIYSIPIFYDADFLITVKGSSMYPKYNSGDIVACKKLSIRDAFFQWNKVYVLDTEQGALVKRVKKSTEKECILLVSDNKDYDPFDIHLTQVRALALVIGVIRLE